jgi:hypothetical protein
MCILPQAHVTKKTIHLLKHHIHCSQELLDCIDDGEMGKKMISNISSFERLSKSTLAKYEK